MLWKVPKINFDSSPSPISLPMRSFISLEAFTVNVATMIFHGCNPCRSSHAVRDVSVCVFPLPGPAKIASVSAEEDTAARCEALRLAKSASDTIAVSTASFHGVLGGIRKEGEVIVMVMVCCVPQEAGLVVRA